MVDRELQEPNRSYAKATKSIKAQQAIEGALIAGKSGNLIPYTTKQVLT